MTAPIFLATDYGLDDEFVGILHAVLARLAPQIPVIDLSHGIAPHDVAGAAALLERAAPFLGDGVLVAVVDPGVGTSRRAIAMEVLGHGPRHLVGPDNGVLLGAASQLGGVRHAVVLTRPNGGPRVGGGTFDGRDVFAPCAARLATGASIDSVGASIEIDSLVQLAAPLSTMRELDEGRTAITSSVRWIDRFGNVQLSLAGHELSGASSATIRVSDHAASVPVVEAYAQLDLGALGVLSDANDAVAIVAREASAAALLGVAVGDRIELTIPKSPYR